MKICLLMLGKTRRPEMVSALEDYAKRISRSCPIEIAEVRDAPAALKRLDANRAAASVLVDAGGKVYGSEGFAKWLGDQRDRGIRGEVFVCGDADGVPDRLRELVEQNRSLCAMT